jgi:hypothetical protein
MDFLGLFLPGAYTALLVHLTPTPNIGGGMDISRFAVKYLAKSNGLAFAFGLLFGARAGEAAFWIWIADHPDLW